MKQLSTKATCNSHGQDSSYFLGWQGYEKNPYDPVQNPNGIIQMGLAENQLSFDLIERWLEENPEPVSFKRNGKSVFRELALFQDYHGLPSFKKAIVEFMAETRGTEIKYDPKNLVLTAGATSANEVLVFCLAEPGEAFLLPAPYYPGFDRDLKWRTGVEIVPIKCTSSSNFKITETALREAYSSAQKRSLRVKGVLITNPSNPLGTAMTKQELTTLLNFVDQKSIHLINDEIYAGTVFSSPDFISVMELLPDPRFSPDLRTRVHMVYSLSKDLGLPGFRVGSIYSENQTVIAAATKMSSFGLVSSQTQYLLSVMLSDGEFVKNYISENRTRLRKRHDLLVSGLQVAGLTCLPGNSGLFSWVDMRVLLKSPTFEAEMELWKKILYEVGLNISPGSSCHCTEPGWFRVCFANMSEETLALAMQRLKLFAESTLIKKDLAANRRGFIKRSVSHWIFRLSSTRREPGER